LESLGTTSPSSAMEPRATVFSMSGRSERPSAKNSEGESGRFFGNAGTTRVAFIAAGLTREGLVTSVTSSAITVTTPNFPEAASQPLQVRITLGAGTANPVTLNAPNCFVFGNGGPGTPLINAVLPSSGRNTGNTRVTIFGTGFSQPLQVFFGTVEASVQSVAFNQIVVLSPPAAGAGAPNLNATVDVRAGAGYELLVVAAVVVGGVAIFGGSGTVVGAALGALLLNTINSALVVVNVSSFWSQAVAGAMLLGAIAFDRLIAIRVAPALRARRRVRSA